MKSDVINIDNRGNGFEAALSETEAAAKYRDLDSKQTLQLRILTEELLGMVRNITGEMSCTFWIDSEDRAFTLHLATKTVMDAIKRYQLISVSKEKKNEAAKGFLGFLRDRFETAILSDDGGSVWYDMNEMPLDEAPETEEWDRYERSILRRLADDIKISVRGGAVDMEVLKVF